MKILKVLSATSLAVAIFLPTAGTSFASYVEGVTPSIISNSESGFTDLGTLTEAEKAASLALAEQQKNSNQPVSRLHAKGGITTQAFIQGFSFQMDGWGPGANRLTNYSMVIPQNVSNVSVYATVTQTLTGQNVRGTPLMTYTLVNVSTGVAKETRTVSGTPNPATVGWSNVGPGTYKIRIQNVGEHQTSGNGYVNGY